MASSAASPVQEAPLGILVAVARIVLGVFFVGSAALKLYATDTMGGMLAGAGFSNPLPFVYFAAGCQVAAGVALVAGRMVVPAAFGLIAYVAIVNWFLHPFWVLSGEAASMQFQLFTKNIGIMAGLLAIAGASGQRRIEGPVHA